MIFNLLFLFKNLFQNISYITNYIALFTRCYLLILYNYFCLTRIYYIENVSLPHLGLKLSLPTQPALGGLWGCPWRRSGSRWWGSSSWPRPDRGWPWGWGPPAGAASQPQLLLSPLSPAINANHYLSQYTIHISIINLQSTP